MKKLYILFLLFVCSSSQNKINAAEEPPIAAPVLTLDASSEENQNPSWLTTMMHYLKAFGYTLLNKNAAEGTSSGGAKYTAWTALFKKNLKHFQSLHNTHAPKLISSEPILSN